MQLANIITINSVVYDCTSLREQLLFDWHYYNLVLSLTITRKSCAFCNGNDDDNDDDDDDDDVDNDDDDDDDDDEEVDEDGNDDNDDNEASCKQMSTYKHAHYFSSRFKYFTASCW